MAMHVVGHNGIKGSPHVMAARAIGRSITKLVAGGLVWTTGAAPHGRRAGEASLSARTEGALRTQMQNQRGWATAVAEQ